MINKGNFFLFFPWLQVTATSSNIIADFTSTGLFIEEW